MNFKKDITIYGVINIFIYFILIILIEYLLRFKNNMFEDFRIYHYTIWYLIIVGQTAYFIAILAKPDKIITGRFEKVVYNFFTIGGYKTFKDGLILTEKEPLSEYILLLLFILIPWPVLKTFSFKQRFLLLLSKIGLFHLISSLVLLDWKRQNVKLNYYYN